MRAGKKADQSTSEAKWAPAAKRERPIRVPKMAVPVKVRAASNLWRRRSRK